MGEEMLTFILAPLKEREREIKETVTESLTYFINVKRRTERRKGMVHPSL